MGYCPNCSARFDSTDRFCRMCGTELAAARTAPPAGGAPAGTGGPRPQKRRLVAIIAVANALLVGGFVFMFAGKGCSSIEGSFTATGEPLGTFTFTPAQCRSGQRMSFFGAALLGEGQNDGGILVIEDAVRGKIVKVEVPGSCEPPDYEKCKVVEIVPSQCETFRLAVQRTGMMVNEIRLVEGSLALKCAFREGGTANADIVFKRCD